jgi:hypothetical protein
MECCIERGANALAKTGAQFSVNRLNPLNGDVRLHF